MQFWLGTHMVNWLRELDVPLMVSHRRMLGRRSKGEPMPLRKLPRARAPWVLDSGGFTELNLYGGWVTSTDDYVAAVQRYADEIGNLAWAAPQDWMVEPPVLKRTGLTVANHQHLTIANFLELDGRGPFIPVLQGWERDDYLRHIEMYDKAGVDLTKRELVGVGTVCRRQHEDEILAIMDELAMQGLSLHGFGVKRKALNAAAGHLFTSADSMAWSYRARRNGPLPGCTHGTCSSCPKFALAWRAETLANLEGDHAYQRTLHLEGV